MKIVLSCMTALALTGCAGIVAPFVNNPYAGTYNGTYKASDGTSGTGSIQLTNLGHVFGTLKESPAGTAGSITGSVGSGSTFNGLVSFTGSPTHQVSGSLNTTNDQVTDGTLSGSGYSITFTMTSKQ